MGTHIHKISKYTPSIFQGKFDFGAAKHGFSLSMEHPAERHITRVLGVILVALVLAYIYFIFGSVFNVMARKEAMAEISKIQGTIGALEKQHFTLSHEVSPDVGATLGLSKVANTSYVYRPGNVGAATIARNEI